MPEDKGHQALLVDLNEITQEAARGEFHDFKNEKYATPKMELVAKLEQIITNVKEGKYDN